MVEALEVHMSMIEKNAPFPLKFVLVLPMKNLSIRTYISQMRAKNANANNLGSDISTISIAFI